MGPIPRPVSVWMSEQYRYLYESLSSIGIGIGIGMSSSIGMVPIPMQIPGISFVNISGIDIGTTAISSGIVIGMGRILRPVSVWMSEQYWYLYESLSSIGIGIGMSSSIGMVPIPIQIPGILFCENTWYRYQYHSDK